MLGVSRVRVHQLSRDDPDFPDPEVVLSGGRVWSRDAILKWAKATGREVRHA
jgi:hypothetical protein